MPRIEREEKQQQQQKQTPIDREKQSAARNPDLRGLALIDASVASLSSSLATTSAKFSQSVTESRQFQFSENKSSQSDSVGGTATTVFQSSKEVNNNELSIATNRNATEHSGAQYRKAIVSQALTGLKMDSLSSSLARQNRGAQSNGKSGSGAAPQSNTTSTINTTSEQLPKSKEANGSEETSGKKQQSVPSYNSIFSTPPAPPLKATQQQQQQQQQQITTNLDEEIFASSRTFKLSTVAAPGQKPARNWSALEAPGSRAPLRKQASGAESKKLLVFNYEAPSTSPPPPQLSPDCEKQDISCESDQSESSDDDQEDEQETTSDDDEDQENRAANFDERLPFNGNHRTQNRPNERHCNGTSEANKRRQLSSKQQPGSAAALALIKGRPISNGKLKLHQIGSSKSLQSKPIKAQQQQQQQQHTKISIGAEQQATICQQKNQRKQTGSCRKLDLLEQVAYLNCECNACAKKRKLTGFVQGHGSAPSLAAPSFYSLNQASQLHHLAASGELSKTALLVEKAYPKTRMMHLILKSIILFLCTLLLLSLLVGTAIMSLTLPQVVDKITNVSRSFNVTIAG